MVRVVRTSQGSESFKPQIVITGAVQAWGPFDRHPPKAFFTEAEALEYGKMAAEWKVDNPARTRKREHE